MKHTILGAGGSIGNPLAYRLLENKQNVRLVSRSKFSINGAESVKADLTSYAETLESIKQSDIVYLCAGLAYDSTVWENTWPLIMKNTIDSCKKSGSKLIFFDNVYMYGKADGKMTENSPYNPCSKKGEVRAKIARMLEEEISSNNITAIIARAADLYGPFADKTSVPYIMVIDKMLKGNKAQWIVNDKVLHSYTYTIDCANGLFLLGMKNEAYGQVWHLPTYSPAIGGKTFIEIAAKEIGAPASYSVLPKFMIRIIGLFNKTVKEMTEMLYQNEYEYIFDSTKFNNYFQYSPKPYDVGIRETIQFFKNKGKP